MVNAPGTPGLCARDNPFRVERVHTFRYRPVGISWDAIIEKLNEMHVRAAVVGPEGSGKTTFLEDLQQRLHAAGRATRWLQLRRDTGRHALRLVRETLTRSAWHEILLIDGAEQMGPLTWRRLAIRSRQHAGLVITVHCAGRLPTLMECTTCPELLEEVVRKLAPQFVNQLAPRLPELFQRHSGNVRLCIREIYDWLASGGVQASG